ncbi:MAG: lipid A biosynthesis acyltransferase [Winogradskyella sp.]|uniref:lysophospholipid acyltransferase family protein n=1 Tax=Winogradskyella sp. TaxID=1883156 RepID=UPI000F3E6484|nr:lysophospholipid acyltransferase family protein [Winogradskyella sp.]RNC87218.1 MAG: lipid A biosynthesis acyltransferase [Winogradskyella sp.]
MQLIAYILIYPILWLISILPFRLLYMLSDVVCFLIYRIFKYRKKVVKSNLRLVFPEKSQKEIEAICSKFYSHLCDLFLEMIKTMSISKSEMHKRFVVKNPEVLHLLEKDGRSCLVMFGHYASYEWCTTMQSHINLPGLVIYKKIANTYFDNLVRRIRSKFNTELVDTRNTITRIEEVIANNDPRMIAFLSDQSPKLKKTNHWLEFMGIEVPCFIGAETTAKKYNFPVGYVKINKVKRGHYEADIILITEHPQEEEDYMIMKTFNQLLEEQIRDNPVYYLWTHKRWKHKDKKPT